MGKDLEKRANRKSKFETTPSISKRMSHVPHERGTTEVMLSKALWHCGIRYRLNYKSLPGSPDIAITKYHIAVFIDGELWHGYDWNNRKKQIHSNREYWIPKIERNMARDFENDRKLQELGWTALHFWSKEVEKDLAGCVKRVLNTIISPLHNSR